jgi:hypothetical protein
MHQLQKEKKEDGGISLLGKGNIMRPRPKEFAQEMMWKYGDVGWASPNRAKKVDVEVRKFARSRQDRDKSLQ